MSDQRPAVYDPYMAEAVLERLSLLAEALDPPVPVAFEELTAEPGQMPRIMLKPLAADAYERRYVSGESIQAFPFSATLRIAGDCEQDSLDAASALQELAELWTQADIEVPGYAVFRQQQLTVPTCLGRTERFEDWQVTMELKYKQTR